MHTFVAGVMVLAIAFISGLGLGEYDGKRDIGNSCLKTGQFTVDGHIFLCERIKVKETI